MTNRNKNIDNLSTCPSCGTKMPGIYCYNCGEKRIVPSDYSLSKFLKQSINFLTHYDSKFINSACILVSHPGFLTKEYFAGRRVSYVKPLQLFFLLNLLFLLLSSIFNWPFFTTPLVIHLNSGFYSSIAKTMVDNRIHELGISYEEYQSHFNHVVGTFAKTLIFIMIPFLALLLKLLYLRSRRYYAEHLIFSIYYYSFLVVIVLCGEIIVQTMLFVLEKFTHYNPTGSLDLYFSFILAIGTIIYLFISLRTVYSQSVFLTIVKTSVITFSLYWVLWGYRAILFFVCFYFS
jgi:hypothetical protein